MDRTKVIRGLECCKEGYCPACPYYYETKEGACQMHDDAIALLKEQEEREQVAHEEGFHDGYMQAMSESRPCRDCQEFDCYGCEHKAVKWE